MTGKEKCQLLRGIRTQLAIRNGLPDLPHKCMYDGDCRGTCPVCDEEAMALAQKLVQKKKDGCQIDWDNATLVSDIQSDCKVNFEHYAHDDIIMGIFFRDDPVREKIRSRLRCPIDSTNTQMVPLLGLERLKINSDGPGIRTLIAVYGCLLNCKHCINPEASIYTDSWSPYSTQEVYDAVRPDFIYFRSTNGGVTFGGGEPLLYPAFIQDISAKLPKNLSKWVETSLNIPIKNLMMCETHIDHFIVDIKALDPDVYHAYTGGKLDRVLENLAWLLDTRGSEAITIRIPIIPGFTTEEDQAKAVAYFRRLGYTNIDEFTYVTNLR